VRKSWPDALIGAALAALTAVFLAWDATRLFDFFDMSAFLDAGYRVYCGQRPYADFFYNAGPLHIYLHALSFWLFGYTKLAIQAHLIAGGIAATLLTYATARSGASRTVAFGAALVSVFAFYGPVGHPWYDQNAWLFVLLGLFAIVRRAPASSALLPGLAVGACAALACFTKSNVGLSGGLPLLLGLLLGAAPWLSVAWASVGFLAAGSAVLTGIDVREFLYQTMVAYDPASRLQRTDLLPWMVVLSIHTQLLVGGLVVITIAAVRRARKSATLVSPRSLQAAAMLAGLAVASIFTGWTSSMRLLANIPTLGFEVALLAIALGGLGYRSPMASRWLAALLAGVCLMSLHEAVTRALALEMWRYKPSNFDIGHEIRTSGLRGLHCNPRYGLAFEAAFDLLDTKIPHDDSVFIYPEMTVLYGLTGRQSYPGAPFIFHNGVSPPPGPVARKFVEGFEARPPQWMLFHRSFDLAAIDIRTGLAVIGLDRFIAQHYTEKWRGGDLSVYRLER
jgi:hypothetical protein